MDGFGSQAENAIDKIRAWHGVLPAGVRQGQLTDTGKTELATGRVTGQCAGTGSNPAGKVQVAGLARGFDLSAEDGRA